VEVVIVCARFS
jgi:hypothetical protein